MKIEFVYQVQLRAYGVAREGGRREEFELTLHARSHGWNLAFIAHDDEAALSSPAWNADWEAAQMRFELLRNDTELCPVWERKTYLAVGALQETTPWGHQDTDAMKWWRRTIGFGHSMFQLSMCKTIIRSYFSGNCAFQPPEETTASRNIVEHRGDQRSHNNSAVLLCFRQEHQFAAEAADDGSDYDCCHQGVAGFDQEQVAREA